MITNNQGSLPNDTHTLNKIQVCELGLALHRLHISHTDKITHKDPSKWIGFSPHLDISRHDMRLIMAHRPNVGIHRWDITRRDTHTIRYVNSYIKVVCSDEYVNNLALDMCKDSGAQRAHKDIKGKIFGLSMVPPVVWRKHKWHFGLRVIHFNHIKFTHDIYFTCNIHIWCWAYLRNTSVTSSRMWSTKCLLKKHNYGSLNKNCFTISHFAFLLCQNLSQDYTERPNLGNK